LPVPLAGIFFCAIGAGAGAVAKGAVPPGGDVGGEVDGGVDGGIFLLGGKAPLQVPVLRTGREV